MHFNGRNSAHNSSYIHISLEANYIDAMLQEPGVTTRNPAPTPGISHAKGAAEDEALLGSELYKRLAGSAQSQTCTMAQKSYRDPTDKKLRRFIRRLKRARYTETQPEERPKIQAQDKRVPSQNQRLHGCQLSIARVPQFVQHSALEQQRAMETEHKQQYNFHQQSQNCSPVIKPVQESLYSNNFIKDDFDARANVRTHTESSAAKKSSQCARLALRTTLLTFS